MGSVPKYDWKAVQEYHNIGNGLAACIEKFGFSRNGWYYAIQQGYITPNQTILGQWITPLDQLLVVNQTKDVSYLKRRILNAGLLPYNCAICGMNPVWNDKPLSLILDHINGVNSDYRLENLRFICPNCDSQTETFCGRNKQYEANNRKNKIKRKRKMQPYT